VVCDGKPVPTGWVSFVPAAGNDAPARKAAISNGEYKVIATNGVPLGKYMVQVDARKPTGRKVQANNGREMTMIDETVRIGSEKYASAQSPLSVEITSTSEDTYNIEVR
jgi:predicted metalloprotease with PDZ domain